MLSRYFLSGKVEVRGVTLKRLCVKGGNSSISAIVPRRTRGTGLYTFIVIAHSVLIIVNG